MSRSHGPTTPTRSRGSRQAGRQGREAGYGRRDDGGDRSRRPTRPSQLTGAERGRYILRRIGHFALMALICILINIVAIVIIGGLGYVIYSIVK